MTDDLIPFIVVDTSNELRASLHCATDEYSNLYAVKNSKFTAKRHSEFYSKTLWLAFEVYVMRTNLFAVSKHRESDTASVELKWIQSFVRFLKNIITVLKLNNIVSFACKIYGEVFTNCYGVYLQIP